MDPSFLIQALGDQKLIVNYTYVCALALTVYDYVLTTHLEVKYIWMSRWSYSKVLYFVVRYVSFVPLVMIVYNQLAVGLSVDLCTSTYFASSWLTVIAEWTAELILAMRTWAIWQRNIWVGIILFVTVATDLSLEIYFVHKLSTVIVFTPPPFPGFTGCAASGASPDAVYSNYAVITAAQVVLLVLLGASAFKSYRQGSTMELSRIIHRDGLLFYLVIFGVSFANTMLARYGRLTLITMLLPMELAVYAVLTSRVLLNMRIVAARGNANILDIDTEAGTDHHLKYTAGASSQIIVQRQQESSYY